MGIFAKVVPEEEKEAPIKAWSLSRLQDFDACPLRVFKSVVEKLKGKKHDGAMRGITIHHTAEAFVRNESDDLTDIKLGKAEMTLAREEFLNPEIETFVENRWGFTEQWGEAQFFKDPTCWTRIILDMLSIYPDGTAIIRDWKSGKFAGKSLAHKEQGMLYAVAAIVKFPYIKTLDIRFVYTDHEKKKTGEAKQRTWVYSKEEAIAMIPQWHLRGLRLTMATDFPATPAKWICYGCPHGREGNCFDDVYLGDRDEEGNPLKNGKPRT